MVGQATYRILHRISPCPRCGARVGEKCVGVNGPGEFSHIERKRLFRTWRQENPAAYRVLRDRVAAELAGTLPKTMIPALQAAPGERS